MVAESARHSRAGLRRGSALLDVVVSLALLGLSGTAMVSLLAQTANTMRHVRDADREVRRASDELGRLAIADRATLATMTGQSVQRGWIITVTERSTNLFDVDIADTIAKSPVLHTTLYRADTSDGSSRK